MLRRSESREEKDVDFSFDALEKAAADSSLRYGSFWADAFRDLAVEGSSSEERLRARARRVEQSLRNPNELVAPDVIPLPNFDESPTETPSNVAPPLSAVSDAEKKVGGNRRSTPNRRIIFRFTRRILKKWKFRKRARIATVRETPNPTAPPTENRDRRPRRGVKTTAIGRRSTFYAAFVETIICPPCGACAWAFLWRASKERAREDYAAAERFETKAQTALYAGKALILAAMFFLTATMIVLLLIGD